MKIVFYSDTVFSFGGVQRVLAVVAKALSVNHDVTILTTDKGIDRTMYGYDQSRVAFDYFTLSTTRNAEYWFCKMCSMLYKKVLRDTAVGARLYNFSFFLPKYKRTLASKINKGHYDVAVGVHAFQSLHLAAVRSRLNVPKTVGWMHNSYEALFEKDQPYLPGLKMFFAHEMRRLDNIVVLTESDRMAFASNLSLDSGVIYNPLTLRASGQASSQHRKFLSVGRFTPGHKGFDILLKAFAQFAARESRWTLEIVGEGVEEVAMRELAATLGVTDRVKFCRFTPDIQRHYAGASVYVLSSRWEGQPLVLVEAMAHGLPVIASDIPVCRELLSGKGVGMMFSTGDAQDLASCMERMAAATDWEAMSSRSLDLSTRFCIGETVARWEELMRSVE